MKHPPLWKRCRVLANAGRLNMLLCLSEHESLYVQELAQLLNLTEDVASKNLQVLASGGFAVSEPVSKYLYYHLDESNILLHSILCELRAGDGVDVIMDALTALTHERRVGIVSILKKGGRMSTTDLLFRAQISKMAGYRHLNKLVRCGWVEMGHRTCRLIEMDGVLRNALIDEV